MAKGQQFERDVCVLLSRWWTGGENDSVFWRTANSGGRATVRGKKGKTTRGQYGDICATDPIGQPFIDLFNVEIKRGYSRHTFADILDCPSNGAMPKYLEWFVKAQKTSEEAGTYSWLLIAKRDRREPLIFVPFQEDRDWTPAGLYSATLFCSMGASKKFIFVYRLTEFLQMTNKKEFMVAYEHWKKRFEGDDDESSTRR